jgi:ATP-dependent DNA ligase
MLLLKTDALPDDAARWEYQLKLDGYRAVAFKTGGKIYRRSRNNKDFAARNPNVVAGLAKRPDETVIDGEVVAFDENGKPSFNALQNYGSTTAPVVISVFDVLVLQGAEVMREPLEARQRLLEKKVLSKLRSRAAAPDRSTPSCPTQRIERLGAVRVAADHELLRGREAVASARDVQQLALLVDTKYPGGFIGLREDKKARDVKRE